jgi:hypothetical protein
LINIESKLTLADPAEEFAPKLRAGSDIPVVEVPSPFVLRVGAAGLAFAHRYAAAGVYQRKNVGSNLLGGYRCSITPLIPMIIRLENVCIITIPHLG